MDDIEQQALVNAMNLMCAMELLREGRVRVTQHFLAHNDCAGCECVACRNLRDWLDMVKQSINRNDQ